MNYFELFELPLTFIVDKDVVRKKYLELSRRHHPDYFAQAEDTEQATALDVSAAINKAVKIFSNRDATIKYVLQLKGLIEEEEKYSLPADFLMEMMDINENVADAVLQSEPKQKIVIEQQLAALEKELYEPVRTSIENYKEGITTEAELLAIKEYHFKKKYSARIHEALNGIM